MMLYCGGFVYLVANIMADWISENLNTLVKKSAVV